MRAVLLLVLLAGAASGVLACVSETVPNDLPLGEAPAGKEASGSGGGRTPAPRATSTTLPGDGLPPNGAPPSRDVPPPARSDGGSVPDGGGGAVVTPPPATPFKRIDVRYPIDANLFVTQCTLDAQTQLVWKTTASGPDGSARWADPAYGQKPNVYGGCGAKVAGEYPIVITSLADGALPMGTYFAKCMAAGVADVYRITGALEGHPSATFQYSEQHAVCL